MRLRQTIWLLPLLVLSCVFLMTAAIPNVPTGTWQTWNPMGDARSGAAAVLLQDGRVLIIGGSNATGPVASADLFGTDGIFSAAAVMHTERSGHTATVLSDGRVLVTGGTASGGGITNSAEIYDPSANSWTLLSGTMVDARSGHTASLLPDGCVLLAGGQNASGAINSLEIFDPVSGSFSGAGVMTSARMRHAAAALQDGRVLIVGGFDGANPLASSDIFDPSAGTSSAGPNLTVARYSHSATTLMNGQIAIIGGAGGDGNGGITDLASVEIFDPTTEAFGSTNATLTTARQGHQAFLLPNNNDVLIVGGTTTVTSGTSSTEQAVASSELFTPQVSGTSGAWTYSISTTGTMNTARAAASGSTNQQNGPTSVATPRPGLVIVGGGDSNGNVLASTEAYGYATVQTDQSDYPPGTVVNISGSGFSPGETVAITLVESPLIDTHGPYTIVADGNGNITDSSFTTDLHDVNVRFWLSAVGSQSGLVVQNTFTDANHPVLAATMAGSGSGKVTSSDGNINCSWNGTTQSGTCSFTYNGNFSNVILTATAASGSSFIGWSGSGGCTGTGTCSASETGNTTFAATATFATNQAPTITSVSNTTFIVGSVGSFTVTDTGIPTPSLTESGTLPSGVTFNASTGVLSGTPAVSTGGTYPITITASNGVSPNATQNFTLTVDQAPAITSATSTTFTAGTVSSFTVTATGFPTTMTFSETGSLPSGVTLTSAGLLSGTPALGTGGTYPIAITASNGISPSATQNFTLTVDQAPSITSSNSATFTVGTAGSFTVTATGFPAPTFSETGTLPSGVTLTSAGLISGTPAAGTSGTYSITITAANGTGANATQNFIVTVNQKPAITSANNTTFTVGAAGTFEVTATGFPAPTLSENGTLPSGVTFTPATGVLSGTPAANTGGTYSITLTAANGVAPNATQTFTLMVDQAPAITSGASTTFTVGTAGSFAVTASGFPTTMTFSETGTLPSGVMLTPAGTLSGTPAAGTGGTYPIIITASNAVSPNATQNFTLTVDQAPAITNATSATFVVNTAGSFTFTATGFPVPTFTESGSLPSGVTLSSSGVLSGTAATTGNFPITVTASNGVSPASTQNFTLTIGQPPSITSANNTSFTVNSPASFTVTATGFPAPTFSETGALPSGVTLTSAGVLSGAPALGTVGSYPITITASNGVGTNTTQGFTLTVSKLTSSFSALTASQTIPYGQASISLGGKVNGYAMMTGAVTITINGTSVPGIALNGNPNNFGPVTFNTSTIPASPTPYIITYTYSGDANSTAATDTSTTLTVNAVTPTVTWVNPAAITYGTALSGTQLNATFTAPFNGGTVTVPGTATYTPAVGTVLNVGTNQNLSVSFVPTDTTDYSNATKTVQINVNPAATVTSISAPTVTFNNNGVVTVTVTSTAGTPTGNVSLTVDSGAPLILPLNGSGVAIFTLTSPTAGTHSLSASYTTQGNFGGSSATGSLQVNYPAPTLTLVNPSSGNLNTTLNVTLTGSGFFSGVTTVSFGPDITVNTVTVNTPNQITANITIPPNANVGAHNVSVTDPVPGGGTSALSGAFTVNNPATSTQVVSSENPSTYGDLVTFTAAVSSVSATPTGSVSFYDGSCGGTLLAGPTSLVNGQAAFQTSALNAGMHSIFACYTPTGVYLASSNSISQQVNQAQATLSFGTLTFVYDGNPKPITVTTSPANLTGVSILYNGLPTPPTNAGSTPVSATLTNANYTATSINGTEVIQPAPVMITVTDPNVTYDGNSHQATIGIAPPVSATVTYNGSLTAPTNAGLYSVLVTVTQTNYTGTGSGTLTINKATPTFSNLSSPSISYGQGPTSLSGMISLGSLYPTGSVSITLNSVTLPAAINAANGNFSASFDTSSLAAGTYTITYDYAGDTNFTAISPDGVGTLTVKQATTAATVSSSAASTVLGQPVVFIAAVTDASGGSMGTPTGAVNFYDGPTLIGSGTLSVATCVTPPCPDQATFTTALLSEPVSHSITAVYQGDSNFSASPASSAISQAVTTRPTSATVALSPTSVPVGVSSTATITVTDAATTGPSGTPGTFVLGANLKTPRTGQVAALLPNGTVLIAGGQDASGNVVNSAEIYDPVAESFTMLTATLNTARTGAASTLLPDGTVLIVGGSGDGTAGGALGGAEIYDPVKGTFTALSNSLTTPRVSLTATQFYNGAAWNVLIAGGQNSGGALNTTETYDPTQQTFTASTGKLNAARYGQTATLLASGQILMAGGSGVSSAELYDPIALSSSSTSNMTADRTNHSATLLLDGNVLITGGTSAGIPVNTTEIYYTAAGTFNSVLGTLIRARSGHTATLLDDAHVLIVGGANNSYPALRSSELYTPSFDPLGTIPVTSSDPNDTITGTCTLTLTGTGVTSCTSSVNPPHVDTNPHVITGTYAGDNVHSAISGSANLTVTKGQPVIAWNNPADITYGTALSATQLNANANYLGSPVSGSFAYTPAAGIYLNAGSNQTLSVTFTPSDGADYLTAIASVQINVDPAHLAVTADPETKAYGAPVPTPLTATISGFVLGQTLATSGITGTAACTTTATQTSHVAGNPYSVTCTQGTLTASNYDFPNFVNGNLTVTAVPLQITAASNSITYGGTVPTINTSNATYVSFVNGEGVGVLGAGFSCSTVVTSASPVSGSPYSTNCSGGVDPDYAITYVPGSITVKPALLQITAASGTMTYGGTLPAISPSNAAYASFVNGEGVAVLGAGFSCSTAVSSASPVSGSPYPTNCSGAVDTNYAITYVPGTITVKPALLQITAASGTMTYGGTVPTINTSNAAYASFVNGEGVAVLGAGFSCSTAVSSASPVSGSPYPTNCSGAVDTNYAITYVPGTITVKPALLQITAASGTMTYGGTVPTINTSNAAYASFVNGEGVAVLGAGFSCSTAVTSASPVSGSPYPTNCSGAVDTNYAITYVPGTITVKSAPLTITASSAQVNYGSPVPAITASYSGFVNGEMAASLTTQPTCTTAAQGPPGGSAVGIYATNCSGATDGNYIISYTPGTVTIVAVPLTITASSPTANYGSTVPAITPSYSGFVNGDTFANLTTQATCTTSAHGPPSGSPAGAYASNCTGATDNNYLISYTPGTVTIQAVPLTITASSPTANYGSVVPAITPSFSGFVNGDMAASLTTQPTCTTAAHGPPSGSPVGAYASNCAGAADNNYIINYTPGAVTIVAVPLIITASSGSMIYGGPIFPVTAMYSGFVNGDTYAALTTQPTCVTTATSTSPVGGNPYLSSCSGAADNNYTISYVSGMVTVQQAVTTTAVVSSSPNNTSTYMQLVTFTATVTPQYPGTIPTGTMVFYDNGVQMGTGALSAISCGTLPCPDQATFSTSALPDSGPDSITAVYSGDGNFVTSTSPAITQTVEPAPNVSLSPLSVSFGNQNVNTTSKPAPVILTNIGDATLNISVNGLSIIPNTDFAQTNNCGSSLAAGKSCTINITFTPIDTGIRTASLQITDNDDDAANAQQIVSLTGSGLSTITGGSLYTDAIFATANGCGSIVMSGGSTVDSFNSTQSYSASHQLAGGNVGTNGNVTLNGSKSAIYGSAAVETLTTGNCSKSAVTGVTTTGGAQVSGGLVSLSSGVNYPAPPAPNPAPPTTTQNVSGSCGSVPGCTNMGTKTVALAPGQYGNLGITGGTTAHISKGTYNINSLTLSGQSILYVDSGPVIVNLAGTSLSGAYPAMDASGGSIQNPSGIPANLQFTYAGSRGLNLTGGSESYATVDAPNALVNMTGGSDFFGSIIASTVTDSGGTAIHYDTNLPAISTGNYIWFNAVVNNVTGLPSSGQVKLYLTNSSVSFTAGGVPYTVAVPNAVVTFNSSTGLGTTYSTTSSRWNTSVPKSSLTGNTFVAGVAFPVPSNFSTGIQNVAWSASFSTDTPGITLQWQWGAAVYTSLNTCYAFQNTDNSSACYNIVGNSNVLGVNAEDGSADTNGTDAAGTPETYKGSVTFGATGGGGTNYTGYFTSGAGVVPTVAPMSVSPSSLDFAAQMQGSTSAALTTVLTNNDSASHMISSITIIGTNAGDFGVTHNCPIYPNTLTAGTSCTITVTFMPSDVGTRTAKIVVNDDANNSPQTVYLSGTGQ